MSRALVLLIWFRHVGGWRTFWRSGRGSPVAMLGKLLILAMMASTVLGWVSVIAFNATTARESFLQSWLRPVVEEGARKAPLPLLGFLLFVSLLAAFEKPFRFNPAEGNFLLAGPFDRRQLVNYKIGAAILGALIMALVGAPLGAGFSPLASVFVGSLLLLVFITLVCQVAGLIGSLLGLNGPKSMRRLALTLAVVVAALAAAWVFVGRLVDNPLRLYRQVDDAPVVRASLTPLSWFVEACLARRVWPDLIRWASPCLALDLALLATVYALDARLQRREDEEEEGRPARPESDEPAPERVRRSFPAFARCGGAGPVAWRQAMNVIRKPQQLALVATLYFITVVPLYLMTRLDTGLVLMTDVRGGVQINPVGIWIFGILAVMLPMTVATSISFDFREDMGDLDVLKALPIGPFSLTVGQLFVPVMIASALLWLALVIVAFALRGVPPGVWVAAAFVPPVSVVVMAVENLPSFWFPLRQKPGEKPEPFEALGHVLLHPLIRVACYGLVVAATLLVTAAAFFLSGQRVTAAAPAAWLTLSAVGLALVALLSKVFDAFDVTRDARE